MKAQSILEYTLILGVVALALTTMQLFFKRGIQASIKLAADEIGRQEDAEQVAVESGDIKTEESINAVTHAFTTGTDRLQQHEGGRQEKSLNKTTTRGGSSNYIARQEQER